MGSVIEEPILGVMINKQKIKNQGIEKFEVEFNPDGSILSVFVKRKPEKCGWSEKISLDAWKLI